MDNLKASQQMERITLGGITPEHFDQFINLVAGWIASGDVVVRFILPYRVQFEFDEDNISRHLTEKGLLPAFMAQLKTTIPIMLQGILRGKRNVAASILAQRWGGMIVDEDQKHKKEKIIEEIENRINYVEKKLVTTDMGRQFTIKNSSKTDIYVGVSWDIVEKRGDSTGSIPPDLVHATVRIVAQRPSTREEKELIPVPYGFPSPAEFVPFVLTMTVEDLRELIEQLGRATKSIKQITESEKRD